MCILSNLCMNEIYCCAISSGLSCLIWYFISLCALFPSFESWYRTKILTVVDIKCLLLGIKHFFKAILGFISWEWCLKLYMFIFRSIRYVQNQDQHVKTCTVNLSISYSTACSLYVDRWWSKNQSYVYSHVINRQCFFFFSPSHFNAILKTQVFILRWLV